MVSEWCLDTVWSWQADSAAGVKERLLEHSYFLPYLVLSAGQVALSMQHCGSGQLRSAEHFSLAELLPGLVLERGWYDLSQAGNKLQILRYSIRKRKRGSQDDKILFWMVADINKLLFVSSNNIKIMKLIFIFSIRMILIAHTVSYKLSCNKAIPNLAEESQWLKTSSLLDRK